MVTTHQAPLEGQTITGCCGLTADELTRPYHLTTDPTEVTCQGWDPALELLEADLCRGVVSGGIAHAENIMVLLRDHEARGIPHAIAVRALHGQHVLGGRGLISVEAAGEIDR